ncbi:energy transducer TonB [Sphingomonas gei]|uniref:energy transducer TonB n=1 Tax=Sphingomonas gei TaxID=1395960 RepID=UPI0014415F36|nr:energy transducer TonB [Sphingomonas gei]
MGGTLLLFSVALYGFLLVLQSPLVRVSPASRQAVAFELASIPVAPPAPPVEQPPGAVQHQQEASSAQPKSRLQPLEAVLPAPMSQPADIAADGQASDPSSSDARAVEQSTAPPAVAKVGTTVAARSNAAAAEQAAAANWQSALLGHLKGFLRYPRQAQSARQEGVTLVSVTVDRQGKLLSARVVRGSGYPILDGEALATVRRGSPVPPPTSEIRGDPVTVSIPIQFSLRR